MEKIYDIIVVGGGPAGMSAAIYGLRSGKSVLTIEKSVFGGQIVNSPNVENIPGFVSISGDEFGDLLLKQVQSLGGDVLFDEVLSIDPDEEIVSVHTDLSGDIIAKTVILATGTIHRSLGLENEDKLLGKNIHFCAVCDGNFYKDKKVVMIGGGNSAFVEANLLANIVSNLVILQDLPYFTADQKAQNELFLKTNVEKHLGTKILEYVCEDDKFIGIKYLENDIEKFVDCDGVFLAVGLIPNNDIYKDIVDLDEKGYFKADESCKTRVKNIFVAGDARTKSLRQVATACSDGAIAAVAACDYLNYEYKRDQLCQLLDKQINMLCD